LVSNSNIRFGIQFGKKGRHCRGLGGRWEAFFTIRSPPLGAARILPNNTNTRSKAPKGEPNYISTSNPQLMQPKTLNPQPKTRNSQPKTQKSKPRTQNPKPATLLLQTNFPINTILAVFFMLSLPERNIFIKQLIQQLAQLILIFLFYQ
jgi:hypothetical protein